jgi:hypothetical protein
MGIFDRIRRHLVTEDGISLVMAIGIMGVLSMVGAATLFYVSANSRSAEYSNADNRAFAIAEAGVAEGLAVIADASDPNQPGLLSSPKTVAMDDGQVTYSGAQSTDTDGNTVWTVTATSRVDNPTGPSGSDVTRTVTQRVRVRGLVTGAAPQLWDRVFHNRTDKCLNIDTIEVRSSVTSRGDLCLSNGGRVLENDTDTGSTTVLVGDDVFVSASNSSVGTSSEPVGKVAVADSCRYLSNAAHRPCVPADEVHATTVSTDPGVLVKPQVDMAYWYENAKPGPNHNCTNGFFPGGFDNDGVMNGSHSGTGEITPANSSYSCTVVEGGEVVGEISWDHLTHVLTISGTIFIDGDIRFDDDGALVNYQGRAIIYAGDDLEFDERVCAGGDGTWDCRTDMSNWNPEENLLILLSNGWSEYDQGGSLAPAAFQGIVYAQDFCLMHQDVYVSGPMICEEVRIQENDEDQGGGWPTMFSWPQLQSLIPGVLYGDTSTSTTYEIELLEQTG